MSASLNALATRHLHHADAITARSNALRQNLVDTLQMLLNAEQQRNNARRMENVRQRRNLAADAAMGHGSPVTMSAETTPSRALQAADLRVTSCRQQIDHLLSELVGGVHALNNLHEQMMSDYFSASSERLHSAQPVGNAELTSFSRAQATVKNAVVEAEREVRLKKMQWQSCRSDQLPALLTTWKANLPDVRDRQMEELADLMLS
ncbi:hypothetical protein PYCC9005_000221 [Savitreella phatthalungensis]